MDTLKCVFMLLLMVKWCQNLDMEEECEEYGIFSTTGSPDDLYLMSLEDKETPTENKFKSLAIKLKFNIRNVPLPKNCWNQKTIIPLMEMIARKNLNIINVNVPLIPSNSFVPLDNEQLDNLQIVGTVSMKDETVTRKVFKPDIKNNTKTWHVKDEQVTTWTYYTKIISKSVENYKFLPEILQKLDENSIKDKSQWKIYETLAQILKYEKITKPLKNSTIVFCRNKDNENVFRDTNPDDVLILDNCTNIQSFVDLGVLAVITPKPFENDENVLLPVVFFETPYLLPEHAAIYPNSTVMYSHYYENLSKGLQKFLADRDWYKVGFVSDNSVYSDDFEAAMIEKLKANEAMYDIQYCTQQDCDFEQAIKTLKDKDARIIIANVRKDYLIKLAQVASKYDMTASAEKKVTWIFRELPDSREDQRKIISYLHEFLSITLSPDDFVKTTTNIIQTIRTVVQKKELHNATPKARSSGIISTLNSKTHLARPIFKITRLNDATSRQIFQYNAQSGKVLKHDGSIINHMDDCTFKSHRFEGLCQDPYIFYIPLVLLVGLVVAVTVWEYFQNLNALINHGFHALVLI